MPSAAILRRPIFIVGAGRSGTSLLSTLLSAHSQIAVAPETHFMKRAAKNGLHLGRPEDFEGFWARLTEWERFKDLGVDSNRCRELVESTGDRSFRSVLSAMLLAYGERLGKARVGEKTPSHSHYLGELLAWFPDAQVIAIQRDPRAVVASQLKTPWVRRVLERRTGTTPLKGLARVRQIRRYASNWAQIYQAELPVWRNDSRVRFLRYEDLVAEPEREVRELCAFLGERFEPAMLGAAARTKVAPPAAAMGDAALEAWRRRHLADTARPVNSKSLDKWRSELSPVEVGLVEACCSGAMVDGGYAPEARGVRSAAGRTLAAVFPEQ